MEVGACKRQGMPAEDLPHAETASYLKHVVQPHTVLWLVVVLAFTAVACASPITVTNPIPLTGSGSWTSAFPGIEVTSASASGSNGVDFASFSYTSDCAGAGSPSVGVTVNGGCGMATGFGADIDTVQSDFFSVDLFADTGTGLLDIYDSSDDLLASADLIGWINITSIVESGPPGNPAQDVDGTFAITPAPEPKTYLTLGFGLIWIVKFRRPMVPR
ncbi:MAG: hypothetical protein ABSG41_19550 [Bryobacteraceae bacterium]|jgi:hypothetical protein